MQRMLCGKKKETYNMERTEKMFSLCWNFVIRIFARMRAVSVIDFSFCNNDAYSFYFVFTSEREHFFFYTLPAIRWRFFKRILFDCDVNYHEMLNKSEKQKKKYRKYLRILLSILYVLRCSFCVFAFVVCKKKAFMLQQHELCMENMELQFHQHFFGRSLAASGMKRILTNKNSNST